MDNDKLDKLVIRAVGTGANRFSGILDYVASKAQVRTTILYRRVDRRLQALRKKGELTYDSKIGWKVPPKD